MGCDLPTLMLEEETRIKGMEGALKSGNHSVPIWGNYNRDGKIMKPHTHRKPFKSYNKPGYSINGNFQAWG